MIKADHELANMCRVNSVLHITLLIAIAIYIASNITKAEDNFPLFKSNMKYLNN